MRSFSSSLHFHCKADITLVSAVWEVFRLVAPTFHSVHEFQRRLGEERSSDGQRPNGLLMVRSCLVSETLAPEACQSFSALFQKASQVQSVPCALVPCAPPYSLACLACLKFVIGERNWSVWMWGRCCGLPLRRASALLTPRKERL